MRRGEVCTGGVQGKLHGDMLVPRFGTTDSERLQNDARWENMIVPALFSIEVQGAAR